MVKIVAIDRAGVEHEVEGTADDALMFILRDEAGLDVEGTCGGTASCGTCHIYVEADWFVRLPERSDYELALLESLDRFDESKSRLACQINLAAELEGLRLTLAPEE